MTTYPIQLDNGHGETLIFERLVSTSAGDRLEGRNEVQPGAGPPMHVHFKQEEGLTVVAGRLGYQFKGVNHRPILHSRRRQYCTIVGNGAQR